MNQDGLSRFDAQAKTAVKEAESPWGQLRADMIEQQLASHLPDRSLRVLDVGCGPAEMAIRFAQAGHSVVAVDASVKMIKQARKRAKKADVKIDFVRADLRQLPDAVQKHTFDVVLCHSVLEYVPEYQDVGQSLARLLAPGGIFSLLTLNPVGRVLKKAVVNGQPAAATGLDEQAIYDDTLTDQQRRVFQWEELADLLAASDLVPLQRYGVRVFTDLMSGKKKLDEAFFDALRQLELYYCARDPYRQIAAYTHIIAGHPHA